MPGHIDMHAHYYGGGLVDFLTRRAERPCLRAGRDGGTEMLAMNGAFPFLPAHRDPEVGLAQMDATGIARRMLTFPGALCVDVLPADEVAAAIRDFNDRLAGLGRQTGGRIVGLAGLPLADMTAAADELRRVRRDLGLPGAILPADYFNTVAEARLLTPVLEAANETGALLTLHPGPRVGVPPAPLAEEFPQYRTSAVALQSQLSQVTLTLILSDLLDALPRIRFHVVNLGGTLPFIFERLEAIARTARPMRCFRPTGCGASGTIAPRSARARWRQGSRSTGQTGSCRGRTGRSSARRPAPRCLTRHGSTMRRVRWSPMAPRRRCSTRSRRTRASARVPAFAA